MVKRMMLLVLIGVAAAACGGGGEKPETAASPMKEHAAADCPAPATSIRLVAESLAFDRKCVTAPANTAFRVFLDNQDAETEHNIAIFAEDPMKKPDAKVLFRGDLFKGAAVKTYEIPAQPAGTYHFHCDVHPTQMEGTFKVA